MITDKVLSAVVPLQQQLSDKGQRLTAVQGTPLNALVSANISPMAYAMGTSPEAPFDTGMLLGDSKRQGPDGTYEHDATMKELVDLATKAINGNFHLARNEIVPATKAVHGHYGEFMQSMEVDAKQPVIIVPNMYHAVWASPQLSGLVERFENVPLNEVKAKYGLPMLNGAELMEMFKTGITAMDELLMDWFENQPAEKLTKTYEKVFVHGQVPIGRATNAEHITSEGQLDRNDLLMVFLVATNFEEHMPDGVTAPLDQLRLMLARIREQAGRAIAAELARRDRDRRNQVLVYAVRKYDWEFTSDGRTSVLVNNDVYKAFLEAGGTPEAIFGAVVSGDMTTYGSILTNKDQNEKRWSRHAALHAQKVAAQIYTYQRESARLAMAKYINAQDDESLPMEKAKLHERTLTVLGKMNPKDFQDDLTAIRRLVCDVLYAHTNARMVLDAMDTAEMENPEMNARECALLACIDLVARWMAAQINVKYA